jgi:hypothetical protein
MIRLLNFFICICTFGIPLKAQQFFTGSWESTTQIYKNGELKSEKSSVIFTDGIHTRTEFPDGHTEIFLPEKKIRHHLYNGEDTVWMESTDREYSMAIKTEILPDKILLGKVCKGIKIFWDGGISEIWFNPDYTVQKQFYENHKLGGIKAVYTLTNGAIPLFITFNSGNLHQVVEVKKIEVKAIDPKIFLIPENKIFYNIPGRG